MRHEYNGTQSTWNQLGTNAKTRPTPGALKHRVIVDATPLWTADDTRLYRSCAGALMYYVLDRADAQLEVNILRSYLRAPPSGAMEALRRVTRYSLGTQDAYVKLRVQNDDSITVELVGYSDSDWAGAESWIGKSQGTGSENVMVARGCSRERATSQVHCFESKRG